MTNKYELDRVAGTTKMPIDLAVVREHKTSTFNLYLLSDLHCGAVECNYSLLEKVIDTIKSDRNSLVVFGGDTIEAIPRGYKINEEGQHCPIDLQIARTINALKPIKEKIVVMFAGNHNTKSRGESIDSDFIIAQALDAPYKTVPSMIHLNTPKGSVKLAGGHGKSTAKNNDIELEQLRKIYPNAQIYFLGHTHSLYCKQAGALVYDEEGKEHWDPVWYVRTGNFLNYAEYARYELYAPQRSGCVMFKIQDGVIVSGKTITDDNF